MRRQLFVLPFLLLSFGCVHARVHIVEQASPNPFVGKTHFFFATPDYSNVIINDKALANWASESGNEDAKDWEANHSDASRKFLERLVSKQSGLQLNTSGQPRPEDVIVETSVQRIKTGVFVFGVRETPTHVAVQFTVLGHDRQPLDIVQMSDLQGSNLAHPLFNQRLGDTMELLAEDALKYLAERTGTTTR